MERKEAIRSAYRLTGVVVTAVPTVENARLFDFQLLAPLRLRRVLCRFSRQQRHPLLTIDLQ